jgi:hypothetical protein
MGGPPPVISDLIKFKHLEIDFASAISRLASELLA